MLRNIARISVAQSLKSVPFRPYSGAATAGSGNNGSKAMWAAIGAGGGAIGVLLWKQRNKGDASQSATNSSRDGSNTTVSDLPGEPTTVKNHCLTLASSIAQGFSPVNSIHLTVCGLHHYAGEVDRQVEAHHYCNHVNQDIHQCVIYDSAQPNARLIGIEYIISEDLFKQLPDEEKKYWHSHQYEVTSGMLVASGIPESAENELMEHLLNTYGKTFHTWQIDRHNLPLGPPQLMMALLEEDEIDEELLNKRDKEMGCNWKENQRNRSHLKPNQIIDGADYYHTRKPPIYPSGVEDHAYIIMDEKENKEGNQLKKIQNKGNELLQETKERLDSVLHETGEQVHDIMEKGKTELEELKDKAKNTASNVISKANNDKRKGTEEPSIEDQNAKKKETNKETKTERQ